MRECERDTVLAVLSDWPKSHIKMPAPNEILKLCRERVSDRIEREAVQRARESSKALSGVYRAAGSSEVGRCALSAIKDGLADCTPGFVSDHFQHIGGRGSIDCKEWARVLKVRHECGEDLGIMQIANYRAALGIAK